MSDKTGIEWTDATWNPIVGCSVVSPGCTNCYAMKQAARIIAMAGDRNIGVHYDLTVKDVKGKPVWTGHVAQAPDATLTQPLRWKRGRRIFVNSMGDLFHESIPDAWIDLVFAVMALCRQHTFQILTKRSKRMLKYMSDPETSGRVLSVIFEFISSSVAVQTATHGYIWPFRNVWLGVSAERQQEAYERIPDLLATAAAVRFVSAEPLLGPIDFRRICLGGPTECEFPANPEIKKVQFTVDATLGAPKTGIPRLDWIIVGGESGAGARPCWTPNVRAIVGQCKAAGVAVFVKQLVADARDRNDAGFDGTNFDGDEQTKEWPAGTWDRVEEYADNYQGAPVRIRTRDRKGGDPEEWPEDLRVRELPGRIAA